MASNNDDDSKSIYRKWLSLYAGSKRISGRTIIDRKQALVDHFRTDAEIMIATESGAEGINLQFCSLLVNYDNAVESSKNRTANRTLPQIWTKNSMWL